MRSKEIKHRKAFFKELGEILVTRHGQNYYSSYYNNTKVTVDETAVRFGRYLRAARVNDGLSIAELASQTKISKATLIALEQGVFLASDIKPKWLKELAKVLEENIEDFNLILGRKISHSRSEWYIKRLVTRWQNWFVYSKASLLSKPIYATYSAILLCFVIAAFLFLGIDFSKQPPSHQETNTLIIVGPEHRLNIIKAEFGLERQVFILPVNVGSGGSCCIY